MARRGVAGTALEADRHGLHRAQLSLSVGDAIGRVSVGGKRMPVE